MSSLLVQYCTRINGQREEWYTEWSVILSTNRPGKQQMAMLIPANRTYRARHLQHQYFTDSHGRAPAVQDLSISVAANEECGSS
jgi:hypothetical protein